jgi:hypothetical protein
LNKGEKEVKLSAKNASPELREKIKRELERQKVLTQCPYVLEKERCLRHLLDGYPATIMGSDEYATSNEVVKKLAHKFPELVM